MRNTDTVGAVYGSWIIACIVGLLAATLLWMIGGWSFMQGAFAAVVIALIFGSLVSRAMSRKLPGPNEIQLKSATAPAPAPSPAPAPAPAAAAEPATSAPEPDPAPAPAPVASDDTRPGVLIDTPRDGAADDLKKISGVGPKLEQTLNELGVYHYEQVAQFTAEDIAWVDERLRFKGRIERDDWVGQAKALMDAKG